MANLKIDRGTTFPFNLTYEKEEVVTTLVGATVRFTMKDEEYDTDSSDTGAEIKKDVTDGNAQGEATITLLPADTATLAPGKYFFDVKVQEAGGEVHKVLEGTITLDGSPTNRLA